MTNPNEKNYAIFPAPTNKKIISQLEKSGSKVFRFPPLEIEKLVLDEKSAAVFKRFDEIDWIIFPDVLTVDFFLENLPENAIDLFEMDRVQVCAFGEAVADRLRFVQLHADVVPTLLDAPVILRALSDFVGENQLSDLNFLLPKEMSAEHKVVEKLIENGAVVVELPLYKAKISGSRELAKLKVLLKNGAIDEFIISSPLDLIALEICFDNEPLKTILSGINVSVSDKIIFQTLREYDFKASYLQLEIEKG